MDNCKDIAVQVLKEALGGEGIGLFSTSNKEGVPHATWMATFAFIERDSIICLSSPDSQKVDNIWANPHVEWLFTAPDLSALVYLYGKAYVEDDPVEFKKHWQVMKDKDRAFFLNSYNSPPGFSVIRTVIDQIDLVYPKEHRRSSLKVGSLLKGVYAETE